MKNETDFKKAFCKSVTHIKGFTMKLACPTFSGVPDLFVIVKGYAPVLLEAKWFGEITAHNFNRKINYTAMQMDWLKESHKVQPYSALGLIGFKFKDEIYAVLCESGMTHINYGFKVTQPWVVYKNKLFDVADIFSQSKISTLMIQDNLRLTIPVGIDTMGPTHAGRLISK